MITAATRPSKPEAPKTSWNSGDSIEVTWNKPEENGDSINDY